jgi:hypothetical protein
VGSGAIAGVAGLVARRSEELSLAQVICWFRQGSTLPRDEVERAMRRFAEEIMPRLA